MLEVDLRSRAGDFRLEVAFRAGPGITALFGPSGAGKTRTLRHLAGLDRPDEGRILLDGRVLDDTDAGIHVPPRHRRVGFVFQEYALFPHLNVASNVAFGLTDLDRGERAERVEALLDLVRLPGFGERRVGSLSGGERQRIALARALAPDPDLLLLDEPFAALDFRVRSALRQGLREIQERTGTPMLLVTHSRPEVRELATHLVVIDGGRVVTQGPTDALLQAPEGTAGAELLRGESVL